MESPEVRRRTMQAVKSKNTAPELLVRRLAHKMGFRFRLHCKDLPGKPDIVFPNRHKAIFVHGCFWHGHTCARGARVPKANREYWKGKVSRNQERDLKHLKDLSAAGWKSLVIWECELREGGKLSARIKRFLGAAGRKME
ncbi:MAG TPA: very short patch repair endonuclease [Candidatus Acidoferrales bacterium]|nr:very short patch repair endonuclease [Candidatus Acidoferrales bacterium]